MEQREITEITTGLAFPEGPVLLPGGDMLVVEIAGSRLTRISQGRKQTVAQLGGGPNGAALGPDGFCYVCNNGGLRFKEREGRLVPVGAAADYTGGSLQRVDLKSGAVKTLYRKCSGMALGSPNDLVLDAGGGIWFTDYGKTWERNATRGAVLYAHRNGLNIQRVIQPLESPNGIGLSPDGGRLYVAETRTGRIWYFDVDGPGRVRYSRHALAAGCGHLLIGLPGYQLFDSLAVDGEGNVVVATIRNGTTEMGGFTIVSPKGKIVGYVEMPDLLPTNICFSADGRAAYATLSATGKLVSFHMK